MDCVQGCLYTGPPSLQTTKVCNCIGLISTEPCKLIGTKLSFQKNHASICGTMMAAIVLDALSVNAAFQSALSNDIVAYYPELWFWVQFCIMKVPICYKLSVIFIAIVQSLRTRHRSKRRLRKMGVDDSTRNGSKRHDSICHSVRRIVMVRTNTEVRDEDAACVWMSWLEMYANFQSPKTPKNISDKVPYRFNTVHSTEAGFFLSAAPYRWIQIAAGNPVSTPEGGNWDLSSGDTKPYLGF
ncbi:uncharacterized protein TNCV_4133201 [Trichonephila clavipes]|uniref:Uncharacterized protein n=1 Tax=Trichonephila clavipes TaxID=2585209 RepID=A0A8X6SAC5_TRICX|nr:uncharacterized protein TNCV_4133201 [Trichonephila clavipes]